MVFLQSVLKRGNNGQIHYYKFYCNVVLSGKPAYLKIDGIQNIVNAALTLLKRFKVSHYSLQK